MPDQTVPTPNPRALSVASYGEVIPTVRASDLANAGVLLSIGDDRSGVQMVAPLEVLRVVVTQAAAELGRLAARGDR